MWKNLKACSNKFKEQNKFKEEGIYFATSAKSCIVMQSGERQIPKAMADHFSSATVTSNSVYILNCPTVSLVFTLGNRTTKIVHLWIFVATHIKSSSI